VVAKPAEDASQSLLKLAELAIEAGFPPGALNIVTGLGGEAGAALTAHPLVRHITFTGSVATGKQVMRAAADRIVPVNLELGGKSPVIVFDDATLDSAASTILRGFTVNAGQTCNACTRLLVHRGVRDAVLDRLAEALGRMRLGHPLGSPDMGPLISETQRHRVQAHLRAAKDAGLSVREFGTVDDKDDLRGGFFVRPALVDGVGPDHAIFHDEVFGPCLSVTTFDEESQAVQLANATQYGLVAAVWTKDVARAMRLAHEIEAGQVYINGFGTGGSVEVPFGGMKSSGIGREKGIEGYINYTLTKSVTAHYA
jgi:aldehyde dehydrogenase (NAD+)